MSHNKFVPLGRALLLIWLLLLGQAHACSGAWVLPDGKECPTCPHGPCIDGDVERQAEPTISTNGSQDCHECCTLTSCTDSDDKQTAVPSQQFQPVFAILPEAASLPAGRNIVCKVVFAHIEAGFPNAPPATSSSRAPPFQLS